MTQARVPAGSGSVAAGTSVSFGGAGDYIVDSTQIPTAITWDGIPAHTNRLLGGIKVYEKDASDSHIEGTDPLWEFVAEDNGFIYGLRYANGATAVDSQVGWELEFLNQSNSDSRLAYFGIGGGTEAVKATDIDSAVAANGAAELLNSTDSYKFNKGDVVQCTLDQDGTTAQGKFQLLVSYESAGRS